MKTFAITLSDLIFLEQQVNVPIIRVVRYLTDGTPIYGYTVPASGFTDPITGLAIPGNIDPFTGNPLPTAGSVVELGKIGTFDIFNTAWSLFLPPVVTATGTTAAGVGEPFGLRNVQGLFNNISLASSAIWGAAFYAFARSSDADYGHYLQQRTSDISFQARIKADPLQQAQVDALNLDLAAYVSTGTPGTLTLWGNMTTAQKALVQNSNYGIQIDANGNVNLAERYANPFLSVYDYTPRMISQTVDSQAALERVDAASGGAYITDNSFYQIKDINTGGLKLPTYDVNGVVKTDGTGTYGYKPTGNLLPDGTPEYTLDLVSNGGTYFKESLQRNLNTLGGDPSLTGWNVLFGQFFDHGLDFIGKGGNTINGVSSKVYIPLDPSDPLYRAPATYGPNDPGNTKLYISRATVANPEAAGLDGMFGTADDIQSPGADGIYGNGDDIVGLTNPNYVNHTSPYIDQSQTYGSDDTTTNLLREWVETAPGSGVYKPGMYLFDGTTLANAWNRTNPDGITTSTHQTLPTLNELRAYLKATGRDDLSWDDINNLRVRDASGKVLDIDPNTAGIQAAYTGHTLIADMLPRIDADHLFNSPTVQALKATPGYVDVLAGFDVNYIQRTSGTADGTYISDYIDLYSGQPTTLGTSPSGGAILNEILLRSIGDHYVAGDGRANENFGLTAIHHVWHENHNWQLDNLINIIGQQQSADPTHSVARAFQVNTGFLDSKGNYVYTSGGTDIAWDQEKMFQSALLINQGEYQHIAIDQYARGMSPNIPLFVQYDSGVNSDVTLDYSQVAFRFGHSQLRETIDALDPNGSLTAAVTHYALEQAFLDPAGFAQVGPTAIALGMTRQVSNEIDEIVTPALQQNLLGQATDLAAINIARGRDLGMPTLNKLRRELSAGLTAELNALNQKLIANPGDTKLKETVDKTIALQAGLAAYTSWTDFGNNIQHPEALVNFLAAYRFDGNLDKAKTVIDLSEGTVNFSGLSQEMKDFVNNELNWNFSSEFQYSLQAGAFLGPDGDQGFESIDAWNGGLAEKHVFLGELGSTFDAIFADQMTRLINGDRFYYFWRLQLGLPIFTELNSAVSTEQFKDVIERTTGARHLTGDVFFYADSHVELGEKPVTPLPTDPFQVGKARNHKYGDLVESNQIGVFSQGGTTELYNGQIITSGGVQYIRDNRPDIGVNPDGTAVEGFNAHEVIGGTIYKDYIDAGDGDDTIYGDDGNDTLLGNAGADHIYGEGGNDLIYGGTLPDFLDGGIGDDEIHGGDDADVLIGAEGNDKLFGENFADELHGNAGDDYLDGGLDADFIYGGEGQDIVVGGEGLDTTYGEWGDDRMFGGAGPDQLFGGYGDDILNAGFGGQNQNVNVDEALGEFGFNIVSFSDITVTLNHSADLNQENINISNVTPFGQLWVNIQGVEGSQFADEIIGYNGSGTVDATLIGNWLIGGGGNDKITTGSGDDVIVGDSVRLDALDGTYDANGVLQSNGILDFAYGAVEGAKNKHFVDLLKSAPDFTFGDTVAITANGLVYTHQTVQGNDTAIYAGALSNFDISVIVNPNNPTVALGFKIKDRTGVETGANGDIVLGIETFKFAGQTFSIPQLITPTITGISNDTGSSGTDGVTKDNTLILSGKAVPNSSVQVYLGATLLGQTSTTSSGNWSFDYTGTTLADGPYVFTAKALITGYTSSPSAPFNVTVDTVALAPTLALANDSGLSSTDKITNSGVVNVSGLETGASWQYSTNNGVAWTNGSGTSLSLTGDGNKSVIVRQTDLAGNTSSNSPALTFTLDTVAPTKTVTIASMTKDTGPSATDFITNDGTAGRTYSGTLSAALIAGSELLQVSVDGGTTWGLATVINRNWTFVDNTAKSGNWTILARVVDVAGNSAPVASRSVTLDQQVPGATSIILDLTAASDSGVSNTDNLTNVARPTFAIAFDSTKAQAGDTIRVINSNNIVLGSATLTAAQVIAGTVNVTLAAATPLSSGLNTLAVNYLDIAGNIVTSATTLAVTYDNQISAASAVTLDLLATSDSGVSSTDNITNVTLPTFAVTFDSTRTQSGDVIEVRRGNTVLGTTTLNATQASAGTVNVTLTTALTSGTNTLSAVHRDAAGNSVTGTSTLAVTYDTTTTAPIATGYTATSVNGTAEANAIVKFSTSASAPTSFVGSATANNTGAYSLDATSLVGSAAGTNYYLYAQDVAGNLSPASSQQVVVGTSGNDLFVNVGSNGSSDLLIGGSGTDTAQYAVAGNAIARTGQITSATGNVNIRTANIDVLTGIEQLSFTGTGYTGTGTGNNQLRSTVQSTLTNNSIAEFTGVYNSTTGVFSFGAATPNATLVVFDSNSGNNQNYAAVLVLGKTTVSGTIGVASGTVSLTGI